MRDATAGGTPRQDPPESVFDAIPFPALIVDRDVRVLDYNTAASGMLGKEKKFHYRKPPGDVLHCIHADLAPKGCGYSDFCADCLLRNTVRKAVEDGESHRSRARLERHAGGRKETVILMLSVSPYRLGTERRYLMLFEEVSELAQAEKILPICSHCKNIRDEKNYWETVEEYFRTHTDLMFSHSICDSCLKTLYKSIEP